MHTVQFDRILTLPCMFLMVIFLSFSVYKLCTSWFEETLSLSYNSTTFWIESFPNNVVVKFSFCRQFFKAKIWNNVHQFWWIFCISQFFFIFLVLFSLLSLINQIEDWKKRKMSSLSRRIAIGSRFQDFNFNITTQALNFCKMFIELNSKSRRI